jgi:hypothetical protein
MSRQSSASMPPAQKAPGTYLSVRRYGFCETPSESCMHSKDKLAELAAQAAGLRKQADQLQVEQDKIDKYESRGLTVARWCCCRINGLAVPATFPNLVGSAINQWLALSRRLGGGNRSLEVHCLRAC